MTIILIWLLMGLIGYAIGQYKGRGLAGFLWGFFLGPIGWLIILIGPDMRPKCPHCGGVIVVGASKCKNCGSDLVITSKTSSRTLSVNPAKKVPTKEGDIVCSICNFQQWPGYDKCQKCGASFN